MCFTKKGETIKKAAGAVIDYSNTADGYILVSHDGADSKKRIFRINGQKFTLPLDGREKTLPLCFGDGTYALELFRQIDGNRYSVLTKMSIDVKLKSEFEPYLRPNTYCEYTADSKCVAVAAEVCKGITSDFAKFEKIYWYILDTVEYDTELAKKISNAPSGEYSWWLPEPDSVIMRGKGICWEYASLCAAMCRSQGIPCKICVGHAGGYHAWNDIFLKVGGELHNVHYRTNDWSRTDLTYLDSSKGNINIAQMIMTDNKYTIDYYG